MSCVFQNLAGLQNRYPNNQWQEILGNCDVQLFLGCTDALTAEFISSRSGEASVAVTSQAKQLGTWRISNYTPEYRETSGVGRRRLLTMDEVLRLDVDKALVIIRGRNILEVDTKKIRPASTTIPIHRGMDVIGKKFAGTAARLLTGARPTARILMVTGNITRPASIAGMALATIAAVVENISTAATAPRPNTMNMMTVSTPSKSIAASVIPTLVLPRNRTIP